jgi:hypothetical protein
MLFNRRDYETAERYWSPNYIQHCRRSSEPLLSMERGRDFSTIHKRDKDLPFSDNRIQRLVVFERVTRKSAARADAEGRNHP